MKKYQTYDDRPCFSDRNKHPRGSVLLLLLSLQSTRSPHVHSAWYTNNHSGFLIRWFVYVRKSVIVIVLVPPLFLYVTQTPLTRLSADKKCVVAACSKQKILKMLWTQMVNATAWTVWFDAAHVALSTARGKRSGNELADILVYCSNRSALS